MRVPDWLNDEAKTFWKRHVKRLPPETDADGFALLADLWARWRATDPDAGPKDAIRYIALAKQIQQLGKLYGLFPAKNAVKQDTPKTEDTDEFSNL